MARYDKKGNLIQGVNNSGRSRCGNGSYIRHVTLRKIGDRYEMYRPNQYKESTRNTEVVYDIYDNILHIGGVLIEKHPKFKNVEHLEAWTNKFFAEGKDGYDADK